jgi:hypothetical protein
VTGLLRCWYLDMHAASNMLHRASILPMSRYLCIPSVLTTRPDKGAFVATACSRPGRLAGFNAGLARRVIACLDVRANDSGDLVVTKGDQYDVREQGTDGRSVRNLGKPVELCKEYYEGGADEVTFLNITGFRDFPLGDLPMLEVCPCRHEL